MNLHSKKDFQDCMLSILEPLKSYYSEEKARLTLGVTMAHYDIGATFVVAVSCWYLLKKREPMRRTRNTGENVPLLTRDS